MTAKEILQEKVTEAAFYLNLDEVDVIVAAMEEYAQQQVKLFAIPVVMPSAIEQFNCRFHHIQEMVTNKGITKDNLISIQLVDEDKLNGDLYKVVHWA